jgi:hypothetical protein
MTNYRQTRSAFDKKASAATIEMEETELQQNHEAQSRECHKK